MLALVGAYLLSLVVAQLAALQLADHFRATEEYILVFLALIMFSLVSMSVLAVTSTVARRPRALAGAAIVLALLVVATAVMVAFAPLLSGRPVEPSAMLGRDMPVLLGLTIPNWIMIVIQWGLVRRRWLRLRHEEELGLWPWFTTMVAGLSLLNPPALEILSSAVRQAPDDMLRAFWAMIAAGTGATLVLMAILEFVIRSRMLRRRLTQSTQPTRSAA